MEVSAYRRLLLRLLALPIVVLGLLALTLAYLGYVDQARLRMDEALSAARRFEHAHVLAGALCHASWLDWLTGAPDVHTEEYLAL